MSNTSKQKRFRWLFALTVFTATSSGCGSWSHHVGKHSMLSHFHKKHHSPYTQCEDCGQIIMNDRHHQCNQCVPQPAFYGFKSTCWNAWPAGWSSCPAPATDSSLLDGESVVLHQPVPVPAAHPQESASDRPLDANVTKELPTKAIVPPTEDIPEAALEKDASQEEAPSRLKSVDSIDDSAAIAPPVVDDTADVTPPSQPLAEQESEAKSSELEPSFTQASNLESTDETPAAQEPASTVSEESSSEEDNDASTDEEVFVHVEKTTPAINTSYELPSVPKMQPPTPVAPASAVVATLPRTESAINEDDSKPVDSVSKSKFAELKRLLKDSRSTALHLSQAKQVEEQVSDTSSESMGLQPASTDFIVDRISQDVVLEKNHEIQPAMLAMPISKKVSLLDRLCPKSAN